MPIKFRGPVLLGGGCFGALRAELQEGCLKKRRRFVAPPWAPPWHGPRKWHWKKKPIVVAFAGYHHTCEAELCKQGHR